MLSQVDILLYLDNFRNIDVFLQGLYYISGNAVPYYFDSTSNLKKFHSLHPPQILENAYATKIFMLKYAEEVVKIMETVVFRVETDPKADSFQSISLKFDLMFTDLKGDMSPASIESYFTAPPEDSFFQKVSKVTYSVNSLLVGINQLVFVTFLNTFSSSLSAAIHIFPTNYKIQGDFVEKLFPDSADLVLAEEINKAYDTYMIPMALSHNKLSGILGKKSIFPMSLPLLIHNEQESDLLYQIVNRKLFSKCTGTRVKKRIAEMIIREIQEATALMMRLKHKFLKVLKIHPHRFLNKLIKEYITLMDYRWGENVIRVVIAEKPSIFVDVKAYTEDIEIANKLRSTANFSQMEYFLVADDRLYVNSEENTILFEKVYCEDRLPSSSISQYWASPGLGKSRHLIVLVHGYLGSSFDMKMLQDTISKFYPKGLFLLSQANERYQNSCINEMGRRLAKEVSVFIRSYSNIQIEKISFIGHSLGGLIIRASLSYLESIKEKFYSFITLACPHLGCLNNESMLIDAGLWVLCKIKQSIVLDQLILNDNKDPRHSILFNLSKEPGINWFKKIYFFSSSQDSYVPFHSARVEVDNNFIGGDTVEYEMANNILSRITGSFHRINTIFYINQLEVGSLIGRSTHIMFLDNLQFLNILCLNISYNLYNQKGN